MTPPTAKSVENAVPEPVTVLADVLTVPVRVVFAVGLCSYPLTMLATIFLTTPKL